jgi:hypothetical protein
MIKHYNYKIYKTIRENGGWENWSMIEIERRSCIDYVDACKIEREWLEKLQANLNGNIPSRTDEE